MNIFKLLSLPILFIGLFSNNITAQEGNTSSEKYMTANDLSGDSAEIVIAEDVFIPSTMPTRVDLTAHEQKPSTKVLKPTASYISMIRSCENYQQAFSEKFPQYDSITAMGEYELPSGSIDSSQSLSLAYRLAQIEAQRELAQDLTFMRGAFKEHAQQAYSQGQNAVDLSELQEAMDNSQSEPSIFEKAKLWVHKKMDNALRAEGFNDDQKELDQMRMQAVLDSVLNSEEVTNVFTSMIDDAVTSGTRILFSRISQSGACVVAVRDTNTQLHAELIANDVDLFMPQFSTDWTLKNFVPNPDNPRELSDLMGRIGTYTFVDKNGYLQLVSFAMTKVNGQNNASTRRAARRLAKTRSEDYICSYVGNVLSSKAKMNEAMGATTYTNVETDQNLTSSERLTFETTSTCDGAVRVKTLKRWETEDHPFINGQVMGVITYWRPKARIL
tara:strand:- start:3966 stop:5294 length:1329 start_codon:yes stop_codon:yes gene_type:complete